ncbi:tape measure protein [Nonomuraea salmonea]|uniref:Tape measure protein n=1 Tax=Nonomuraea salmonea TaxID=46181 RepID=A0ABV5P304_9ACTN
MSSAFVEIVADTSKLEDDKLASQIKKSIGRAAQDAEKGLDGVADAAERVGKAVGEEIADGAKDAAKALGEVGAEGLGDVEDAAKRAGRAVGDELTGGARKAAKALGDVGADGLDGVEVQAERAGRALQDRLVSAARVAGRSLDRVAEGLASGTGKVRSAAAAVAAQVARPFQAAGRAIQTALETAVVRPGRLMAGLAVQAGRSAREIGSAFVESSRVAQSALNAINSVSFAPVVAKARAAGAMIGSAFSSATARAERALTPIQGILTKRVMKPVGYTVAGIAGIAAGIAGFGLVWAAELEQTTISFTALLGSAKAARDYVAELQQFAAETPFEFQGLADAAMRLLAMGKAAGIAKKEILPTLTIIGDIAAVLGQGQEEIDGVVRALGQMASKGKTSMEELHQISERLPGFSAVAAIAAARGTSTGQAMDDIAAGAVTGREGIDAILKGMQQFKGAAGAMEAQSETLAGRWSAFKDQLKIAMTDAIQPLVPTAKKALDQLGPVLAQGASALVPSLGTLLEAFTPFLSALVSSGAPVLAQLFGVLAKALQILTPLLGPVLGAFGQLLAALTPLMGPIGAIASLAGTILAAALRLLAAILTPIVSALSGPLTTAIAQLQPAFSQLAAAIMPVASQLAQQLAPILPQLIPPFLQLAVALIELLAAVMPILPPIIQLAGALLNLAVSKVVVPLLTLIVGALTKLLGAVTSVIGPIAKFVGSWDLGKAWNAITSFVSNTVSTLTNLGSQAVQLGANIINGMIRGVSNMVGSLISTVKNAASSALSAAKNLLWIFSPSRRFEREVGRNMMLGWIRGIVRNSKGVKTSVEKVAKDVLKIGRMTAQKSFVKTLTGDDPRAITNTLKQVLTQVRKTFKGLRTTADDRLITRIRNANKTLTGLAKKRADLAKRIQDASKAAEQIAGRARDYAGIVGLGDSDQVLSPTALESLLRDRLIKIRRFTGDLEQLARRGLDKDLIRQLADAGPEQAGGLARSLTTASAATIASLTKLNRDISRESTDLGKKVADHLYDAGRKAGAGFLDGLRAQQAELTKIMERMARTVASTIRKTLKMRSPSKVTEDLGDDAMQGFFDGIENRVPELRRLLSRAVAVPSQPVRTPRPLQPIRDTRRPHARDTSTGGRERVVRQYNVQAPVTVHAHGSDPRSVGDYIEARIVAAVR